MITSETFVNVTKEIAMKVVKDEFVEASDYFATFLDDHDWTERVSPFDIAYRLQECDRPRRFPKYLVNYIIDLYQMEIEAGNHHAMNNLGARYYYGDRGFEQDFKKAVFYYKMAAKHGNRQAQQNLGYCYYYGRDMEKDYEKAFQYFAVGAFAGDPVSLYKIGDMYLNGYYVQKDEREAFIIYNRCLDMMDDDSSKTVSGPVHLRLGDMCLNGIGTEMNPEMALLNYSIAEISLYRMVKDGDYMYKNSLHNAIEGQRMARAMLTALLPEDEWALD